MKVPLLLFAVTAASHAQLVRQPNSTLVLPSELPAATTFTTENALGSLTFSGPLDMASPRGVTNRLFVVERALGIQMVNLDTMTRSTFLDLSTWLAAQGRPVYSGNESGILSMAFHPNYNENGYFYLFYSSIIGSQLHQRVARFTATGTPGNFNAATTADPATEAPLITQNDSAGNHNGGDIAFGPDGYLYFSTGDEGPQHDAGDNARRIAKDFFGAIFRIDVDSKPGSLAPNPHDESSSPAVGDSAITAGSFRIPPDNPFVALAAGTGNASYNGFTFPKTSIRTEIFSIGYRNPWRMSFDPHTGRLFVGDVGQATYEEVSLVTSGFNAGWSWREGKHNHTPAEAPFTAPAGFQGADPIYEYDHTDDGAGNDAVVFGASVAAGVVYRGDRLPELFGKFLFSEYYYAGAIVALTEQPDGTWTGVRIATDNSISGWGYDPRNDDALLCDHVSGTIKHLVRSGTSGTAPPATLSATGAFSNLAALTPNAGIFDYEPNVSFWSDYAVKSRWFSIRNLTDTITFSAGGNWSFPAGMVWIKHFDIDTTRGDSGTRRKLETRFLVKTATDVYGLSYKWRADQSEADLVAEDGLSELIPASNPPQTWHYPSRTDCRICHTAAGGFALSFNTKQMNRPHLFGAETLNQISALSGAGYFSAPVSGVNTLPAFAAAGDISASLEWRVRSFLAVNCVQCHQPGGTSTGFWDARATTPTDLANLIDGQLVNDGGNPDNRWSVPGDTAHSMILKRLSGTGVPRMPPLATGERDLAAEQLLTDWINALTSRQSYAQWQTEHFGPAPGGEAAPGADPDNDGPPNDQEYLAGTLPTDPSSLWSWSLSTGAGGMMQFEFMHPANRSMQIEASSDLLNWTLWDVPGNAPAFPASSQLRTFTAPAEESRRFFRPQFRHP